jgi:hypothetical protein
VLAANACCRRMDMLVVLHVLTCLLHYAALTDTHGAGSSAGAARHPAHPSSCRIGLQQNVYCW